MTQEQSHVLHGQRLTKQFRSGDLVVDALRGVDITIDEGEVVAIIDGVFEGYIECDSEQQAEVVAGSRIIYGLSMNEQPCDPDRVQRCLDALRQAGLNEHAWIVRKLLGYAETLA